MLFILNCLVITCTQNSIFCCFSMRIYKIVINCKNFYFFLYKKMFSLFTSVFCVIWRMFFFFYYYLNILHGQLCFLWQWSKKLLFYYYFLLLFFSIQLWGYTYNNTNFICTYTLYLQVEQQTKHQYQLFFLFSTFFFLFFFSFLLYSSIKCTEVMQSFLCTIQMKNSYIYIFNILIRCVPFSSFFSFSLCGFVIVNKYFFFCILFGFKQIVVRDAMFFYILYNAVAFI